MQLHNKTRVGRTKEGDVNSYFNMQVNEECNANLTVTYEAVM